MQKKIEVKLGSRSYPIFISGDRFRTLGKILRNMKLGPDLFIVASPEAKIRYGPLLKRRLVGSGLRPVFLDLHFPKGKNSEKAKSGAFAWRLIRTLIHQAEKRKRVVLAAFSGGVLGDLTGFVAAIYKRGVPYLQIPTTLLAQVDSSIGGKVGIDLPEGKNLIGSFYQPRLVYSELTLLKELPKENLREGLAEIVKYGVVADPKLFSYLEKNHATILPLDDSSPALAALEYIVSSCVRIKADVVSKDERDDRGIRVILNFGHTLGHAIEQAKGYGVSHGKAISVGMLCESEIARRLGLFKESDLLRLESLLVAFGLPTAVKGISLEALFKAEAYDKKFIHGKNRYVLPVRIGKVVVREGVPYSLIREVASRRIFR